MQVDHSSITAESTNFEVMSLYRFLILLERVKRVSTHKISYTDCTRKTAAAPGQTNEGDGFNVTIKDKQKYKSLPAPSERAPSAKSFFASLMSQVEGSKVLSKVFRFRFERVHAAVKIQKQYCMAVKAISLKANQPCQVG